MKGAYIRDSHCGNASPLTGDCIIGCDPGRCDRSPEQRRVANEESARLFALTPKRHTVSGSDAADDDDL